MVPLEALHEERRKRQAAADKLKEFETRQQQLMQDNLALMREKDSAQPIEDLEAALRKERDARWQLEQQLAEVASRIDRGETRSAETKREQELARAAQELNAAGIPTPPSWHILVAEELKAELAKDPANEDVMAVVEAQWASPDAWKQIYTERVYPSLKTLLSPVQKAEADATKVAAKKAAGIPQGSGSPPPKAGTPGPLSYEEYLAQRTKTTVR